MRSPSSVHRSIRNAKSFCVIDALSEACSRKEFFDELADNLEARSDRYTHQSGPGIIALFYKRVFQWLVVPSSYSNPGCLLWGEQYCTGCPVSTEQGEEISDNGYDPCVFAYLVHGSPHPVERSQRQ